MAHHFQTKYVPLAQLDRAFDYESKGQEFESLRARHYSSIAQLVERPTVNRMVTGSNPVRGAIRLVGEAA